MARLLPGPVLARDSLWDTIANVAAPTFGVVAGGPAGFALGTRPARIAIGANALPNPVHKKLTYHYGYGNGAPLALSIEDRKR